MPFSMFIAAMVAAETLVPPNFMMFQRSASLIYVTETVMVAPAGRNAETNQTEYRIRYTWQSQLPDVRKVSWIDSRTCPKIHDILASMKNMEMPKPYPGELGPPVMDGAVYLLEAPSSDSNGHITITSNTGSPLATWVDGAFNALASCLPKDEGPHLRWQRR